MKRMTPAQLAELQRGIRNGTANPAALQAMVARAPQRPHNPLVHAMQQLRAVIVKASQGLNPRERIPVRPRGWSSERINPFWCGEVDDIRAALTQREEN
jgi:hypothetical protein